jgi:regulator of PEP synthase PpsR (kinase-PPPase family)
MPTQAGFWIRTADGEVTEVWDTTPPSSQKGWVEAVEVKPDIVPNQEMITTHSFDLDTVPAQIVWAKRDLEVSERKDTLKGVAADIFKRVVNIELSKETGQYPTAQYDAAVVAAAQATYEARVDAVDAATTHADVDAL